MNEIRTQTNTFSLAPTSLNEAMKLAEVMANSDMVPKDYKGKPGNVLIAVQMGAELGLQPMQAIQNIAVINGRPAVWGDAALAIVSAHPECEDVIEKIDGAGDSMSATCTIKRRGRESVTRTFTVANARLANLWNKEGPWKTYPQRMLQMRARSWALRDSFADALRGIGIAEEVRDTPMKEMGEADVIISKEQFERISTLMTEAGGDTEAFKAYFKIDSVNNLLAKDYDRAVTMIETRIETKRKKAEAEKLQAEKQVVA